MIDVGRLARPPRATLPHHDVRLADGRLLGYDAADTARFAAPMARAGRDLESAIFRTAEKHSLLVIASVHPTPRFGDLLHISFSYNDRNPSWKEVRLLKEAFYGSERDAMLVLPREQDYVNVHQWTFHLWECPQAWALQ